MIFRKAQRAACNGSKRSMRSGNFKGGPGWAMVPIFLLCPLFGPLSFFLNFPFKFVWLTYAGLPNAFCKNTGHFVNSDRSKLCRNSEAAQGKQRQFVLLNHN